MRECYQELCEHWGGDGRVCTCSLMGLTPTGPEIDEGDADA